MTETFERLRLADVATRAGRILDEVERVVVGKRAALELALCAQLADVLIEDYPGSFEPYHRSRCRQRGCRDRRPSPRPRSVAVDGERHRRRQHNLRRRVPASPDPSPSALDPRGRGDRARYDRVQAMRPA